MAELKLENGDFYEGDVVDNKPHGKGKYTTPNGNIYEGDFADGRPHGQGKYTFASGAVYEGDFADGKLNGKGKYTYENGDVYEGDWVNNNRTGNGKYTYASGKIEEGQWKDDKFKGVKGDKIAVLVFTAGTLLFAAFFAFLFIKLSSVSSDKAEVPQQRMVAGTVPSFVSDAVKNAPPDALVGIGVAKMATLSQSMTIATVRARADIARQINLVILQMVREYAAVNDTDHSTGVIFQERITVTTSKAGLSEVKRIEMDEDEEGNFWVVVMMEKENVSDSISRAHDEVKSDFSQMPSFDVGKMLPRALDYAVKEEIVVAR